MGGASEELQILFIEKPEMPALNLNPEQESDRIRKVREVMSGPRSQEWEDAVKEGIRKAVLRGAWSHKQSEETIEKRVSKLRGKPRPQHVKEALRKANTGRKLTPLQRQKVGQGVLKGHATMPLSSRKQMLEIIRRNAEKRKGKLETSPNLRKGHKNKHAIKATIRSSENIVYDVHNVTQFVRDHEYLFSSEDLMWRRSSSGSDVCRASKGITNLFVMGKVVPGSWKGWTVVSRVEQETNFGLDLLRRPNLVASEFS